MNYLLVRNMMKSGLRKMENDLVSYFSSLVEMKSVPSIRTFLFPKKGDCGFSVHVSKIIRGVKTHGITNLLN